MHTLYYLVNIENLQLLLYILRWFYFWLCTFICVCSSTCFSSAQSSNAPYCSILVFLSLWFIILFFSIWMTFLNSAFLVITIESITGNSVYNCCSKDKISSKTSGGWTPNGAKMKVITKYANKGGILTPIRVRKSVKKVMLAFRSRFLFCGAPELMNWLRILFALMNSAMYITMGT